MLQRRVLFLIEPHPEQEDKSNSARADIRDRFQPQKGRPFAVLKIQLDKEVRKLKKKIWNESQTEAGWMGFKN